MTSSGMSLRLPAFVCALRLFGAAVFAEQGNVLISGWVALARLIRQCHSQPDILPFPTPWNLKSKSDPMLFPPLMC